MNDWLKQKLVSPIDKSALQFEREHCVDDNGALFPIVNGVPILLDNRSSIFQTDDFNSSKTEPLNPKGGLKAAIISFLNKTRPSITINLSSQKNYRNIEKIILAKDNPFVLIVGAGDHDGEGLISEDLSNKTQLVKTDIFLSKYIDVICDSHSLPFISESFDIVIIQAVLEHVASPYKCVSEIHRVLKPDGLVYSETPFMQQVHMGAYDFTRFTHLGHRRLFRQFSEIESGATCGTGTALAWSIKHFIRTLFRPSVLQFFVEWFFSFFYFWLKYFDYLVMNKPGIYDAASGYFFFGKKSEVALSDRELIKHYKGMMG
jgi:SAM-dependent methyltransferase